MKILKKIFIIQVAITTVGGVIAGVLDRKRQKRSNHASYGIYEKYIKRLLDFILSVWAIIMLSPVMVVIAIFVRFKLGKPVLFVQKRPGRDGKVFALWKFRSMTEARDKGGRLLPDEERIVPYGQFLRRTSLDELPGLFNIAKGDMSIVGPRPLLVRYLPFYNRSERHRHDVRPGLTGLAQVNGRNVISWDEKFEWDLKYVEKITFLTDVKIVLDTLKTLLQSDDVVKINALEDFDVYRKKQSQISDIIVFDKEPSIC